MMSPFSLVSSMYAFFATRRVVLFAGAIVLLLAGGISFLRLDISENIQGMLPEEPPCIREEFRLLQGAPFSRKVLITLTREDRVSQEELFRTADALSSAMGPPYFDRVISGPPKDAASALVPFLLGAFPNLFTDADRADVEKRLNRGEVRQRLEKLREQLYAPGAWGMKSLMRQDPLGFHVLALRKLGSANAIPNVRIRDGHFISPDGKRLLLMADSPIGITDAAGSRALLARFEALSKDVLPEGIHASLVSGHRYAAANADTIKGDLVRVLGCSSILILVIFFVFLRNWRAVFVFLMPVSALFTAALCMRLFRIEISGITIGFGAVLLGITVDYAIHVYFALRNGTRSTDRVLFEVSRPVLFSGLTSLAAFATLLLSDLPGQRQLALFSILGIATAMVLSLTVLPHVIPARAGSGKDRFSVPVAVSASGRRIIAFVWLAVVILGIWQATHVEINGDLRSASMVTPELKAAEQALTETWGKLKGRAIAFAVDVDLQRALEINDELFALLTRHETPAVTSLAPVLPSLARQSANRERWMSFWEENGKEIDRIIHEEGRALGFSAEAFNPFLENIGKPCAPLLPRDLRAAGLGDLLDTLMIRTAKGVQVITLADAPLEQLIESTKAESKGGDVRWVSEGRFGDAIGEALGHDFIRFIVRASVAVLLVLLLLYRNPLKVGFTLLPVVTGLLVMFGVMGAVGMPFNLFNIIAAILVIGLGVDYGIFMVVKLSEGYAHATEKALLVSGLTTLAGLGSLVLARHPALHSIGVTVLLGIGAAIPAALLAIPSLYGRRRH
ncbi:MAG: MMPL family transporter [Deltaproteobacteria bacterium]|nr:MMPL family transporter [Deltaproteobacteria bacterium]